MKNSRSGSLRYGRIVSMISLAVILSASFSHAAVAFKTGESASLVIGNSNFTTAICGSSQSGLCFPNNVAFDSSGNLWILDGSNSRVLEFTPPFSSDQLASLVIGQSSFAANTCSGGFVIPVTTRSGLCNPFGLAFDSSGNLWVADSQNNRVLEFTPPFSNGQSAHLVIGQSSFTTNTCSFGQSGLCGPSGLAFDSSGNLWVADSNISHNRVLEFKPPFSNGEAASLVIGKSSFTIITYACSTTSQSGFCGPDGLAFDSSGDLWVADSFNSRVLEFSPPFSNGEAASLVIGQSSFISSGCFATQSGLCFPTGLAFDSKDNLWVSDAAFGRVLEFTPPFSNSEDASLVIGQPDFGTCCESFTSQSDLHEPSGLAFDSKGNLWIADTFNSRVLAFAHHHHIK